MHPRNVIWLHMFGKSHIDFLTQCADTNQHMQLPPVALYITHWSCAGQPPHAPWSAFAFEQTVSAFRHGISPFDRSSRVCCVIDTDWQRPGAIHRLSTLTCLQTGACIRCSRHRQYARGPKVRTSPKMTLWHRQLINILPGIATALEALSRLLKRCHRTFIQH